MLRTALRRTTTRFWRGCTHSRGARGVCLPLLGVSRISRSRLSRARKWTLLNAASGIPCLDCSAASTPRSATGGSGPEGGLASLTPRRIPHWHLPDWHCATAIHANRTEWGPPTSWLFLTGGGCTMEWYVSLIAVDHPVLLWDADGWEPDWARTLMTACVTRRHHCASGCGPGQTAAMSGTKCWHCPISE